MTSAPVVTLSGVTNASTLVIELFDATSGGPPIVFTYNASSGTWIANGPVQLALGDTYYFGSRLGLVA